MEGSETEMQLKNVVKTLETNEKLDDDKTMTTVTSNSNTDEKEYFSVTAKEDTKDNKVDDTKTPEQDNSNVNINLSDTVQSKVDEADATINKTTDSIVSETGNIGDNEDESESEGEELPPGLLEKPVEVEGKRERKKTSRFNYDNSESKSDNKKELKIPDGSGVPLSQHPRVVHQLSKNKITDLRIIHKLLFGTLGEKRVVKSNILKFKGFTFEKETSEFEKKEEEVGRFTVSNLKWVMEVCDAAENLSACKTKDDLVDTFMVWLLNPKPQNKAVVTSKKKTMKRKKKVENDDAATTDSGTPVKKQKKKSTDKNVKPKEKKKKTAKKVKTDSISDVAASGEESSQTPSNAEIKKYITKILDGADLEKLTMKSVFLQVYEHYPTSDMTDRKPFIKETVKKLIS